MYSWWTSSDFTIGFYPPPPSKRLPGLNAVSRNVGGGERFFPYMQAKSRVRLGEGGVTRGGSEQSFLELTCKGPLSSSELF